ncbi:hypothetical protein [Rhodophyticola sp. CCM32]|nr:hypothetical protein [Rhodophyticola sp. CCM32]
MFRLIRLAFLLIVAFVAGMVFERQYQQDRCDNSGGTWMRTGFCAGG